MDELLRVEGLKMYFDGLKAIDGLTLSVYAEKVPNIIGLNGAGRTTLFNVTCDVYKPTGGKVLFRGAEVQGLSAHEMAHKGVARTFQVSKSLKDLTILDNTVVATGIREYTDVCSYFGRDHTPGVMEKTKSVLGLARLEELRDKKAHGVSLGYLCRLEVARVLVVDPPLIMPSEPAASPSDSTINQITELALQFREQKKTIVLIEHNLPITMKVCSRTVMLNYGKKIAEGIPA